MAAAGDDSSSAGGRAVEWYGWGNQSGEVPPGRGTQGARSSNDRKPSRRNMVANARCRVAPAIEFQKYRKRLSLGSRVKHMRQKRAPCLRAAELRGEARTGRRMAASMSGRRSDGGIISLYTLNPVFGGEGLWWQSRPKRQPCRVRSPRHSSDHIAILARRRTDRLAAPLASDPGVSGNGTGMGWHRAPFWSRGGGCGAFSHF